MFFELNETSHKKFYKFNAHYIIINKTVPKSILYIPKGTNENFCIKTKNTFTVMYATTNAVTTLAQMQANLHLQTLDNA
jgi:hypothetical protein